MSAGEEKSGLAASQEGAGEKAERDKPWLFRTYAGRQGHARLRR